VTGGIRLIPFEFVVWNLNLGSDVDMRPSARFVRPIIGNGGVGLAASDMDFVGPVGVGFSATLCVGNVGLHQGLVPLPDCGVRPFPLTEIACADTST